jgi:protein tyrosine/serine phosphatase
LPSSRFWRCPRLFLEFALGYVFLKTFTWLRQDWSNRSAQLLPEELESVIAEYGIRSVISLASPEPEQSWYQGEVSVTSAHKIARYEIPLSRGVRPTADQIQHVLSALRKAPKPILLHSQSGADRAGLVAAIFQYAIASRPASEAGQQLSIRYSHFPSIWPETAAMDASFDEFVLSKHRSGS